MVTSTMGLGLVGKKVGEVSYSKAPKGVIRFEILKISYELDE
ncbi:MAG: GreA/GreB family elongation factor [Planctomycetota bacterium]